MPNLLGTLQVSDPSETRSEVPEDHYSTFTVSVSVHKPDLELLALVERAVVVLLVLEVLAMAGIIFAARDWSCVFFVIPLLFRYAAFPTATSLTHAMPSFILLHSIVIGLEALLMLWGTIFSFNTLKYTGSYTAGWVMIGMGCLTFILLVRLALCMVQQKNYNRLWMSHILSKRSYFFNLV